MIRNAIAHAFPDLPPLDAPTVAILKSAMGNTGERTDWAVAEAEFRRVLPALSSDIEELKRLHPDTSETGKEAFAKAAGVFREKLYRLIVQERTAQ